MKISHRYFVYFCIMWSLLYVYYTRAINTIFSSVQEELTELFQQMFNCELLICIWWVQGCMGFTRLTKCIDYVWSRVCSSSLFVLFKGKNVW